MSAQPEKHDRNEPTPAEKFVDEWAIEHAEVVLRARAMQAMTSTPAWRGGYIELMKDHRAKLSAAIKTIEQVCDRIGTMDVCEDDEKEVRDAIKSLAEERIAHRAWENRSIRPCSSLSDRCRELREIAMMKARFEEQANPLTSGGLVAEVQTILGTWPRVVWDANAGTVSVVDVSGTMGSVQLDRA